MQKGIIHSSNNKISPNNFTTQEYCCVLSVFCKRRIISRPVQLDFSKH